MKELILGVDVGTTGTKTLLVDRDGGVLGSGYREYSLMPYPDGRVEQNADDWTHAVTETIREALQGRDARAVRAIGLSTQGASMLPVDAAWRPLGPVITWMDARAKDECASLVEAVGEEAVYRKCGWSVSPGCDAAKVLWLSRHDPAFARTACFVSTLEYVNRFLTGRGAIDPTNAAIRQLFNIGTGRWDDELLSAVGVGADRLPEVLPTGAFVGTLTPEAAASLGLPEDVRVYNGAHDQYCASLGCGAVEVGDALLSTGTTWVLLGVTDKLLFTPSRAAPGIHPAPGRFGVMCSLVSAGSALKWWRGLVDGDYSAFDAAAASHRASAAELLFYPYLAGAGFPHKDPDMTGTAVGLRLAHDENDVALALMEGVAFEARLMLDALRDSGVAIDRLTVSGGAARSDVWCGLTAAATGCALSRARQTEACCMGAAMLGAVGAELYPDLAAAARGMTAADPLPPPDAETAEFYREKFSRYKSKLPLVSALYQENTKG